MDIETDSSTNTRAFRGVLWFLTGSGGSALINFVVSLFLARLLLPSEFGLAILLLSITSILQLFSEMGLSIAVVQRKELDNLHRDNAIYVSVGITALISILTLALKEPIANILDQPKSVDLIPLIVSIFFIRAFYSPYRAIMLRALAFRTIAMFDLASYVLHGSVAIALAYSGFEAKSVLWGQLASACGLLIGGILYTKIIPTSPISKKAILSLLGFGLWVSVNRLLSRAASYIDKFIIAITVNSASLGAYHLAQQLATTVPNLISRSIDQTMLPIYSRQQDDLPQLERTYWKTFRISILATLPMVMLPASHAKALISLLYGDKWDIAAEMLQIISVSAFAGAMGGGIFGAAFYASGKTKMLTLTGIFRIISLPLCLLIGSQYGSFGVCWGFAAFGIIGRFFNQLVLSRALGFSMNRFFKETWRPAGVSAAIAAIGWNSSDNLLSMLLVGALQLSLYFIFVRLLYPIEFSFLFNQLRVIRFSK